MTQEEFVKILKEDKFFEDFREHAMHRYPVVKYYLKHYPRILSNEMLTINTNQINLLEPTTFEECRLINEAFYSIKRKLKV